eukprot:1675712-Prymnesium_polylepis.1
MPTIDLVSARRAKSQEIMCGLRPSVGCLNGPVCNGELWQGSVSHRLQAGRHVDQRVTNAPHHRA